MAAKTKFSEATINNILKEYDIGELKSLKPFKAGYVQTNILIETTNGKYVLRYYENRDKHRVEFEAKVLHFLAEKNYPTAKPVINKNKKYVGEYKKKSFIIFSYLPGRHLRNLNNNQIRDLVHHLALLHKLTEKYQIKRYNHAEPRTKEFCVEAAKEELKRYKNNKKGKERFERIKSLLDTIDIPETLPKSIVHGDFDKANIKFLNGKLSGVLDFDDSQYGTSIHDLGIIILYWARFYNNKMDYALAKRIIKYYEEKRKLSKKEKAHLYDVFVFAATMIMAWLMYDKWKGKDIFQKLSNDLKDVDRETFNKKILGTN